VIDIHNHILPGLDDGASDWDASLEMARMAVEDGIEAVVCTPHWVSGVSEVGPNTILELVESFRERLTARGVDLAVHPGAELRVDAALPYRLADGQALTLNQSGSYALIELPMEFIPRGMENLFYDMQVQGITPVLAHPERNSALRTTPQKLFDWVKTGIIVQITAASLLGRFGEGIRKFSVQLMERGVVHVIATDSHGPQVRTPVLSEARHEAGHIVGPEEAWRMVHERPLAIIKGEVVSSPEPAISESRSKGLLKRLTSLFR